MNKLKGCTLLGFANYYVFQWTGFRLSYELTDEGKKENWAFIRMKPGSNWIKSDKP